MTDKTKSDQIQGEGDYKSARRYDKAAHDFAESGKVEPAARAAKPHSEAEAREMKRAEEQGKARAKGEDPTLNKGAAPRSS
jgi:hypothetical protein